MLKITGYKHKIKLTRGDTAYLHVHPWRIPCCFDTETDSGDKVIFTCKESDADDAAVLFEVTSETLVLKIKPEDTKNLEYGVYPYDIEINTHDGDVFTVVSSTIELTKEVRL